MQKVSTKIDDYVYYEAMVPPWLPGCRRLTPAPGYLVEDNVNFITDNIVCITEEGILTTDGKERKVDAIMDSIHLILLDTQ
jgi:hypothetical protein